ncbi:hypothetical protein BMS3Bbin06_01104 [bacterium BMS3Bbin06]|nr:hypothetical protein BMS3Bbin06_01104 [bacterium BMS3Bbin06]
MTGFCLYTLSRQPDYILALSFSVEDRLEIQLNIKHNARRGQSCRFSVIPSFRLVRNRSLRRIPDMLRLRE